MKKWIVFPLLMVCIGAMGQADRQVSIDAKRVRVSAERSRLEDALALQETACYSKFLVNRCLDEVKARRREGLSDLRRQEIVLNDEVRKTKAAEQLQKIEDKSSPEKLKQQADKQAQAGQDYKERLARDKQKNSDREALQAGEKAKSSAAAGRIQSSEAKMAARTAKLSLEAEEARKYNERQEQARQRQARYASEKASQTKAPAQPLPTPK